MTNIVVPKLTPWYKVWINRYGQKPYHFHH